MSPPNSAPLFDPTIQVSLRVDNDSQLPALLEGRTVAVLGQPLENLTAEAHEPNRKLKLHQQLIRARRLRATLEDAAARADALPNDSPSSYSQSMEILQSTIPQMNELVRLTEALRGNYTLEDDEYGEWNEWTKMRDELEEAEFMREQRIIRRQLRELGMEANRELVVDAELEQRHDALISRQKDDSVEMVDEECESDDRDLEERIQYERNQTKNASRRSNDGAGNLKQPEATQFVASKKDTEKQSTPTANANTNLKTDPYLKRSTQSPLIERIEREKALFDAVSSVASDGRNLASDASVKKGSGVKKRPLSAESNVSRKKKPKKERAPRKDPPENIPQAPISTETVVAKPTPSKPAAAAAAAGTSMASRPNKKCHHCKESTSQYRRCAYWQVTGTKCGKIFCIDCLSSNYTLGNDVLSKDNPNGVPIEEIVQKAKYDSEWHCPSCLNTCICNFCVKQRQVEEERERSQQRGSRRSGRRSAS